MYAAPGDESPVGTMPESADQKYHKHVPYRFPEGGPRSPQWYIEIIPEPGGKADMPSSPEFRYGTTEVWILEIDEQLDAEEFGDTARNVGIAAEVAIYLDGKA